MKRAFLSSLWDRWGSPSETATPEPGDRIRLSGKALRVPWQGLPFAVEMGRQRLQIHPDLALDAGRRGDPPDFLLFDPQRYLPGPGHFLRLAPGQTLAIRHGSHPKQLLSFPREAFRRGFELRHEGDALAFRDPISELGTYLTVLASAGEAERLLARRRRSLERVLEIFGGPLEPLAAGEACAVLERVNRLLRDAPHRPKDAEGNAGGLIELPGGLTPVLVGDLHARVDNLLKILSENGVMDGLERGTTSLILLGDAVHPEAEDEVEEMDTSVLVMDLVFKLLQRFPSQVFFLLGNHDSFSSEVMKRGVPQGALWRKRLRTLRGEDYVEQMELFYRLSPLVVVAESFVACHAGPPRARVSRETLVDVRRYPAIVHELTWTRARTRGYPTGYSRTDVHRFRKSLGLERDVPLIVAHQQISQEETVWLDARQIPRHHVVFSAQPQRVGVILALGGEMLPQVFPAEPIRSWLNEWARRRV